MQHYERLIDLNEALMQYLFKSLKLPISLQYTKDYAPAGTISEDYRNLFTPKKNSNIVFPPYSQVFEAKMPFIANLSILDLLFNLGPEAKSYLESLA